MRGRLLVGVLVLLVGRSPRLHAATTSAVGLPSAQSFSLLTSERPDLTASRLKWPSPVDDRMPYTLLLADLLEFSPKGRDSDLFWDVEGWHGGDYNRLWVKTEGTTATSRTDYDLDLQVLYGRFLWRYYDLQVGGRMETKMFGGRNVVRGQGVIGLEGLVPYRYEIESALFISQDGDVSARVSLTRDVLFTQRLILQGRLETDLAVQRVERFGIDSGLTELEAGLRLRYEFWREFAPYVGVSYRRSFFGTADLVRREGGDPSDVALVVGLRLWY